MLTKTDLAKYPFTVESSEYVKSLRIGVAELTTGDYDPILDRAEQRISESEKDAVVSPRWQDTDVEILSFPTAVMLVSEIANERVSRRYALSESKRAYEHLREETSQKILEIAMNTFGWRIAHQQDGGDVPDSNYSIHFVDYLRNAKGIRDPKWKLINRILENGIITVAGDEVARLLEEEVQRKVYSRIRSPSNSFPESLSLRVKRLKEKINTGKAYSYLEMPKVVLAEAMPPCIKALNQALTSRKHLSHMGRFTLTSFLLNVGVSSEDLVKMFREVSDFSERLTRYQVEHIGGSRGVKTRYSPPKCDNLKTHGLCVNPDELCRSVRHPLSYYKKKIFRRRIRAGED
jgi:DNA primase large subunit